MAGRGKCPKPYRSWLEFDLADKWGMSGHEYETLKLKYDIKGKVYNPDFIDRPNKIMYEAKGRFRSHAEISKYLHIRDCNPDWTLRFIVPKTSVNRPAYPGKKLTMADWFDKHNFEWAVADNLPESWRA